MRKQPNIMIVVWVTTVINEVNNLINRQICNLYHIWLYKLKWLPNASKCKHTKHGRLFMWTMLLLRSGMNHTLKNLHHEDQLGNVLGHLPKAMWIYAWNWMYMVYITKTYILSTYQLYNLIDLHLHLQTSKSSNIQVYYPFHRHVCWLFSTTFKTRRGTNDTFLRHTDFGPRELNHLHCWQRKWLKCGIAKNVPQPRKKITTERKIVFWFYECCNIERRKTKKKKTNPWQAKTRC